MGPQKDWPQALYLSEHLVCPWLPGPPLLGNSTPSYNGVFLAEPLSCTGLRALPTWLSKPQPLWPLQVVSPQWACLFCCPDALSLALPSQNSAQAQCPQGCPLQSPGEVRSFGCMLAIPLFMSTWLSVTVGLEGRSRSDLFSTKSSSWHGAWHTGRAQ